VPINYPTTLGLISNVRMCNYIKRVCRALWLIMWWLIISYSDNNNIRHKCYTARESDTRVSALRFRVKSVTRTNRAFFQLIVFIFENLTNWNNNIIVSDVITLVSGLWFAVMCGVLFYSIFKQCAVECALLLYVW